MPLSFLIELDSGMRASCQVRVSSPGRRFAVDGRGANHDALIRDSPSRYRDGIDGYHLRELPPHRRGGRRRAASRVVMLELRRSTSRSKRLHGEERMARRRSLNGRRDRADHVRLWREIAQKNARASSGVGTNCDLNRDKNKERIGTTVNRRRDDRQDRDRAVRSFLLLNYDP